MISYASFIRNKPLSELSTFRIGGPADYFVEAADIASLTEILKFCHKENLPYIMIGKGSNCLFHDKGFRGLAILNKIDFLEQASGLFRVGSGYSFSLLGVQTARKGFCGLEFASGIPATVGGAVFMNAGANGKETADTLVKVEYLEQDGTLITLEKEQLQFSYRHSPFQKMKGAIVSATFMLSEDLEARKRQLEIIQYRQKTQPLSEPSAGCIFRNPGFGCPSAGAAIEQANLKGFAIGGVKVSEKHANFIVNTAKGSASDVLELISHIKHRVKESSSIDLQEEVRLIPETWG